MSNKNHLYRMEASLYSAGYDEWGDSLGTVQRLRKEIV